MEDKSPPTRLVLFRLSFILPPSSFRTGRTERKQNRHDRRETEGDKNGDYPCTQQPSRPRDTEARVGGGLHSTGEVRILVLDDYEQIGRMIREALEAKGFRVDAVSDTRQVGAHLRQQPYHLIILDYVLPGLDSDQVL